MIQAIAIDRGVESDGSIELSNDCDSCRLFWAVTLDSVAAEHAEELSYRPDDGDNCITVLINGCRYPMVPLPALVRELYFRYAQKLALGPVWYTLLVRVADTQFTRRDCAR